MARFVRLTGCEKCGSRDNFATYDDGSGWCFGCHFWIPPSAELFDPTKRGGVTSHEDSDVLRRVSKALGYDAPPEIAEYLGKYGISVRDFLRCGGRWDADKYAIAFVYNDREGNPICIQRRSFRGRGPKYLSEGSTYEVMDINGSNGPPNIVITEDKLSAIKVGSVFDASPALGTQYQHWKLVELLKRGYKQVYVWLDRDKWREGMEICDKAKWLGLSARAVYSELDPKCYTVDEIKGYLA